MKNAKKPFKHLFCTKETNPFLHRFYQNQLRFNGNPKRTLVNS